MENYKTFKKLNSICIDLLGLMKDALKDHNMTAWSEIKDAYDKVSILEDKYLDNLCKEKKEIVSFQ